jgi:hypothetical protein
MSSVKRCHSAHRWLEKADPATQQQRARDILARALAQIVSR